MDTSTELFWNEFELKTGEKPRVISMGQVFEPGDEKGEWGLVFFTDTNLRCRHMPSQGGFMGLVLGQTGGTKPATETESIYPLESILEIVIPPRTWKHRLFGSPFRTFSIRIATVDGQEKTVSFATDPARKFPEKLQDWIKTKNQG